MSRYLQILALVATLSVISILIYQLFEVKQEGKELIKKEKVENGQYIEVLTNTLAGIIKARAHMQLRELSDTIKLKSVDGRIATIEELLEENETMLILKFGWSSCEDCQAQEIGLLNQMRNRHKVIIVGSFSSSRDFFMYMKNVDTSIPFYYLENSTSLFSVPLKSEAVYALLVKQGSSVPLLTHSASSSFPKISKQFYEMVDEFMD